jgi:hypothetical protein
MRERKSLTLSNKSHKTHLHKKQSEMRQKY